MMNRRFLASLFALFFLWTGGAASAEPFAYSCSGSDCSFPARWAWEEAVSVSLAIESSNLSAVVVTANGTAMWNGTERGNASGALESAHVTARYPNMSMGETSVSVGSDGRYGSYGHYWMRIFLAPVSGVDRPGVWLRANEAVDFSSFSLSAEEVQEPFVFGNLTWDEQPNSTRYWNGTTDGIAPVWVPLAWNGTVIRESGENGGDPPTPYSGWIGYLKSALRWEGRGGANGSTLATIGPARLPLNVTGPNLTVSGTIVTDAAWVTGYATVEGANVSADFTLNGTWNYTLKTMTPAPVKRGTYTANAKFGGLGCESGAVTVAVSGNGTIRCVIVGSPPNPLNQPLTGGGGGGGGGGAGTAPPPQPATPPLTSSGGGESEGGAAGLVSPTPPPACYPGSLTVRNESGELVSLRCRSDGSGWDPERNLTAEEKTLVIRELNRSGMVPPVASPGFEVVAALAGLLFAAGLAGRRDG